MGPAGACMLGAATLRALRFAGLVSGLELMSTMSAVPGMSARLLGKWYMSAVLIVAVVVASGVAIGELARRERFLVGESGTADVAWGLDCVVKRSLMVFSECFRFSVPGVADIGGGVGRGRLSRGDGGGTVGDDALSLSYFWRDARRCIERTAAHC